MTLELPQTIPIFPLREVILLPGSILPLHIFEPRYRQMVEDVTDTKAYIGMIQPQDEDVASLYTIGGLGKIDLNKRLPNGNYLIRLQGIVRFKVEEEISSEKLYRQATVNYLPFLHDLEEEEPHLEKDPLYTAFRQYLDQRSLQVDWEKLEMIPIHHLVNILAMNLEFPGFEKQTLLESHDITTRWHDLITLLQMASLDNLAGNHPDVVN